MLAPALTLLALALAPSVAGSQAVGASVQPVVPAILPAELQALVAKMASLQIASERFSSELRGLVTSSEEVSSSSDCTSTQRCHATMPRHLTRRRRHLLDIGRRGEVDLAAGTGEVFDGTRPSVIAAGSTLYLYAPGPTRRERSRPWLREAGAILGSQTPAGLLFPFHGSATGEVNLGGSGPYAGLINLLETATGPVSAAAPATVVGQPTVDFTATVRPALLIGGLSAKQLSRLRALIPSERVEVFINHDGLPLRVVAVTTTHDQALTETTNILAVNTPLDVKPPPPARTRSSEHDSNGTIRTITTAR